MPKKISKKETTKLKQKQSQKQIVNINIGNKTTSRKSKKKSNENNKVPIPTIEKLQSIYNSRPVIQPIVPQPMPYADLVNEMRNVLLQKNPLQEAKQTRTEFIRDLSQIPDKSMVRNENTPVQAQLDPVKENKKEQRQRRSINIKALQSSSPEIKLNPVPEIEEVEPYTPYRGSFESVRSIVNNDTIEAMNSEEKKKGFLGNVLSVVKNMSPFPRKKKLYPVSDEDTINQLQTETRGRKGNNNFEDYVQDINKAKTKIKNLKTKEKNKTLDKNEEILLNKLKEFVKSNKA